MEMLPAPCKPRSAPVGLSLWAHSAKVNSVYRVHRHDRDPVYRVHDPGVYQVDTLGRTLWGQGLARHGSLLPTPPPSLHCIPDETCSMALLGEGTFCPREPTPDPPHPRAWTTSLWELGGGRGGWWEHEDHGRYVHFTLSSCMYGTAG